MMEGDMSEKTSSAVHDGVELKRIDMRVGTSMPRFVFRR
jgi:hypothetical protein